MKIDYADFLDVATHEAGHAVMSWHLGERVKAITVLSDAPARVAGKGGYMGSSAAEGAGIWNDETFTLLSFRVRLQAARRCGLILYSGPFAEGLLGFDIRYRTWRGALLDIREMVYDPPSSNGDVTILERIQGSFAGHRLAARLWEYWALSAWTFYDDRRAGKAVALIVDGLEKLCEGSPDDAAAISLDGEEVHRLCRKAFRVARDPHYRMFDIRNI